LIRLIPNLHLYVACLIYRYCSSQKTRSRVTIRARIPSGSGGLLVPCKAEFYRLYGSCTVELSPIRHRPGSPNWGRSTNSHHFQLQHNNYMALFLRLLSGLPRDWPKVCHTCLDSQHFSIPNCRSSSQPENAPWKRIGKLMAAVLLKQPHYPILSKMAVRCHAFPIWPTTQ
jgi:hypothetical protein